MIGQTICSYLKVQLELKSTVITHILNLDIFSNKSVVYSAMNKAVSVLEKYSQQPDKYSFCTCP